MCNEQLNRFEFDAVVFRIPNTLLLRFFDYRQGYLVHCMGYIVQSSEFDANEPTRTKNGKIYNVFLIFCSAHVMDSKKHD